jgi:predicted ribosomally synthesized peptide with SipW-like signal peptide
MTNKSTKRALLASVMAMLLCFTMLLGTTFAWFTDSAASGSNVITAGNLVLEVEYTLDGTNWDKLDGADALFQMDLWEPGHTEVVALRVTNAGTLNLKYAIHMNIVNEIVGKNKDGGDIVLSEILTVSTLRGTDATIVDGAFSDENGVDYEQTTSFKAANVLGAEKPMAPEIVEYLVIKVDMADTVGNEANHDGVNIPSIEFGIDVLATQYTAESDSFGDGYDADAALPEVITNATDLAAALTADEKNIAVTLFDNVDLPISSLGQITGGSGEYKLGGEDTESIVIDLNGHKLNITTTYWSNIGAKNANATMTIKNGTMTSSQPTGTWNSYDLTFSNCDYVFENVTFDKAVAFDNEGKSVSIKNVTVNETHDYYAMWITAEGQNVTIDGLTVNSDNGRGIKIDEQYVDAPAKVALNISNAKFNTAKKAAIIVKSAAGADIALSNVNVSNTVDPIHAVWVDEDAASYADLVTVTGGAVVVEGSDEIPVANSVAANTTVTMGSVITAGGTTVIKNAGAIDLSGTPNLNGGDVIINGGTVVTTSQNYTGLQHAGEVTYNDVTFNGSTFLYGEKVVFNNCTFNLTSNYIWTYGAEEVEFNNCTFNTNGKAVLIYTEGSSTNKVVTIKDCTFNATTSGFASAVPGQPCAAVEIDSSLISGSYTVNFVGENVVDSDFSGLVRIKAGADKNNVTINGATAVDLP